MYLLNLTYQAPLSDIDKYLQAHRDFLEYYYQQGLLIASGPLSPRTGGIIIAVKMDRKKLEDILSQDPFYQAGLGTYTITEFTPVKHCAALSDIIQKTEGKLC